jgi:type III secretory pathway component EscS
MTRNQSQLVQHTLTAITLVLVLGALSLIWPVIIAVFLGILLLLQSFSADQEMAVLSLTKVGHVPILFSTLR